jgi:glycopeptide antibiotics resistance protein
MFPDSIEAGRMIMQYRKMDRLKSLKVFLMIMYLVFIGYFGFISKIAGRTQSHKNKLNLIPFNTVLQYFSFTDMSDLLDFIINIFGNLIVFMPVGMFIQVFFGNRIWSSRISYVLIIGFLFSLGVESTQLIMSVGVFDVDDLLLNTVGALIGWYLYRHIWKVENNC